MGEELKQTRFYLKTEELLQAEGGIGNVVPAFNNSYDVFIKFNSLGSNSLSAYLKDHSLLEGTGPAGIGDYIALFCSEAVLPGSQITTQSVDGLRQGVTQHFATYRRYPDINLTFYSQKDYYTNEIFDAWLEYISPTLNDINTGSMIDDAANFAYKRLRYPKTYKCDMSITAFSNDTITRETRLNPHKSKTEQPVVERQEPSSIRYELKNAFPINIVAAPLAYGNANLIKTTLTFKYDQFYVTRASRSDKLVGSVYESKLNRRDPDKSGIPIRKAIRNDFGAIRLETIPFEDQ
tara:strand:+ start:18600 stop:19478 length:879 start_codon:yes stop_codon:yes gene_type:complete